MRTELVRAEDTSENQQSINELISEMKNLESIIKLVNKEYIGIEQDLETSTDLNQAELIKLQQKINALNQFYMMDKILEISSRPIQ